LWEWTYYWINLKIKLKSRSTVTKRLQCISDDTWQQLRRDAEKCEFFSLQLDESTDTCDVSQVSVFIQIAFSVTWRDGGEDTFRRLQLPFWKWMSPFIQACQSQQMSMTSGNSGLIGLCKRAAAFPHFLASWMSMYKCDRFSTCDWFCAKILNSITVMSLQHMFFKNLLDETSAYYGDMMLHVQVHWLSRRIVLFRW
jgi:hypothetical protein